MVGAALSTLGVYGGVNVFLCATSNVTPATAPRVAMPSKKRGGLIERSFFCNPARPMSTTKEKSGGVTWRRGGGAEAGERSIFGAGGVSILGAALGASTLGAGLGASTLGWTTEGLV